MQSLIYSRKNMIFAVGIWVAVSSGLIYVLKSLAGGSWVQFGLLLGPPLLLELFILISTVYLCRVIDIQQMAVWKGALQHLAAAVIILAVWMQLTMIYSEVLVLTTRSVVWRELFNQTFTMLAAINLLFYFVAVLFHYLILNMEAVRQAKEEALEEHLAAAQAELKTLKDTVHPHFLFNSLAAMNTLIEQDAPKARELCGKLTDFLRYSLQYGQQEWVTLSQEMEHVRNYLEIEKIRLGGRLKTSVFMDEGLEDASAPPFLLLPLVENAVKHGVSQSLTGGVIEITTRNGGSFWDVQVRNNVPADELPGQSKGHGLRTLERRLWQLYNGTATIKTHREGDSFRVVVRVPAGA